MNFICCGSNCSINFAGSVVTVILPVKPINFVNFLNICIVNLEIRLLVCLAYGIVLILYCKHSKIVYLFETIR